jgi:hypothetical protein
MTADDEAVLAEIQDALAERWQESFATMVALHGGIEAWHAACQARRAARPNHALARVICRLLRRGGDDDGQWRLPGHDREKLLADADLAAYWQSVASAGDDGWCEERRLLRAFERDAARAIDPQDRLLALDSNAVEALIPTWRAWGRILRDVQAA